MNRIPNILAWQAGVLLFAACALAGEAPPPATEPLAIVAGGATHAFTVEVARTPAQQQRGLMFRESLAPDAGMLFLGQRSRVWTMWMKNTLIPLDMLFIAGDGRIEHIAADTTPYSLATISSGKPVRGVLEIAGGRAAQLGIAVGDRVLHPAFTGPGEGAAPPDPR